MADIAALAQRCHHDVHAAKVSAVPGEPEAQLTTPVSNLFTALVEEAGLGRLRLIRESHLEGSRPDFAALHQRGSRAHQVGFIELKNPSIGIDPENWTGRNASQWQKMSAAAVILLLCNGRSARLYQDGEPNGEAADLPFDDPADWDEAPLLRVLRRFLEARPTPITSVSDLSRRLALRTADLRDRLLWLLGQPGEAGETARGGFESWKQHVHPRSSERDFADGVSQVVAYGMVLAALSHRQDDSGVAAMFSIKAQPWVGFYVRLKRAESARIFTCVPGDRGAFAARACRRSYLCKVARLDQPSGFGSDDLAAFQLKDKRAFSATPILVTGRFR